MSEDLTKKLKFDDTDMLTLILTTVQNIDQRSTATEARFTTVEARLERLEIRFYNFDSRLQRLEQRVEQRFYDTRPIWHKVVADIATLQEGQHRVEEGLSVLNDALRRINSDLHAIDERLGRLEVHHQRQNSST
jgi:hypothetical protein